MINDDHYLFFYFFGFKGKRAMRREYTKRQWEKLRDLKARGVVSLRPIRHK